MSVLDKYAESGDNELGSQDTGEPLAVTVAEWAEKVIPLLLKFYPERHQMFANMLKLYTCHVLVYQSWLDWFTNRSICKCLGSWSQVWEIFLKLGVVNTDATLTGDMGKVQALGSQLKKDFDIETMIFSAVENELGDQSNEELVLTFEYPFRGGWCYLA